MGKKRKATSPLHSSSLSTSAVSFRSQTKDDIEELRQRLSDLQRRLQDLELENDALQQRARQACLVFAGSAIPECSQEEKTGNLMQELLLKHMGFALDLSQVKAAFRLRNQNIFVEFTSVGLGSNRDSLYRQKTRLKGTGLFVSESLTPKRQMIMRDLLQLKKEKQIWAVYTQSGNIFVRKTSTSTPIRMPDMSAVKRLTEDVSGGHSQPRAQTASPVVAAVEVCHNVRPGRAPAGGGAGQRPPSVRSVPADPSGGDPAESRRPAAAGTHRRADPDTPDSHLEAPLRAPAVASEVVPIATNKSPVHQSHSQCDADSGHGPVPSTASPVTRRTSPAALRSAGRPVNCKLRVEVGSRSRIISVNNGGDVMETLTDLIRASERKPEEYLKCMDKFWGEYSQCVERIVTDAEGGGPEARKVADKVRRVKASADQLIESHER